MECRCLKIYIGLIWLYAWNRSIVGFFTNPADQRLAFFLSQRVGGVPMPPVLPQKTSALAAKRRFKDKAPPRWVRPSTQATIAFLRQEFHFSEQDIKFLQSMFPPLCGEPYWKTVEDYSHPHHKTTNTTILKKIKGYYDLQSVTPDTLTHLCEDWGLSKDEVARMVLMDPNLLCLRKAKISRGRRYLKETFELSDEELRRVVKRAPSILHSNPGPDGVWSKVYRFLELNLAYTTEEARKTLLTCPQILHLSATGNLEPCMQAMCDRYEISADDYANMVLRYPPLLVYNMESIMHKLDTFEKELGLRRSDLVKLITSYPCLIGKSWDNKVVPTMNYLRKELGLSAKSLKKVVIGSPEIFGIGLNQKVKPTVRWFHSLGFKNKEIGAMLTKLPSLFSYSLENNLSKKLAFYLDEMQVESERLSTLFKLCPALLGYSLEGNLRPKLEYLTKEIGIDPKDMDSVLRRKSTLLSTKLENYKMNVDFLRSELELKPDGIQKMIKDCPSLLVVTIDVVLQPTIDFYTAKMGLTKEALGRASVSFPRLWSYSLESNIKPKARVFLEDFGADEEYLRGLLLTNPSVFGHSLQSRILPRLKTLKENGIKPTPQHIRPVCKFSDSRFSDWLGKNQLALA